LRLSLSHVEVIYGDRQQFNMKYSINELLKMCVYLE
jgi:hypothetical protein